MKAALFLLVITYVSSQDALFDQPVPTVKTTEKKKRAKALVIFERPDIKYTHSVFLTNLKNHAEVTFKSAIAGNLSLVKFGVNQFHDVFLMAPSVEAFGGNVTSKTFGEYVDNGGNLLITTDHTIGDGVRAVAAEFGIEFDENGNKVINNDLVDLEVDDGSHTSFVLMDKGAMFMGRTETIVGSREYYSIPWNGIGINLTPDHQNAIPVLKCTDTCYSWNPEKEIESYPNLMGRDVTLVAALQMRNRARVMVSGSHASYSDAQLHRVKLSTNKGYAQDGTPVRIATKSSLPKFIMHTLGWVMNQKGRFRVRNYRHFLYEDVQQTKKFFINDTVRFEVQVEEYIDGEWFPIHSKQTGFMAELNRMNTFVRRPLRNEGSGLLATEIRLPDKYGIFEFRVVFKEPGYTTIDQKFPITIHPLSYDMYERFLPCAFPYYASAFSMMAGVFLMAFAILYHEGGEVNPPKPKPQIATSSPTRATPKTVSKRTVKKKQ